MKSRFQAVQRPMRLSDTVQSQIYDLITARELKDGDRLPPERELADLLGVSRTVVREAIRSLAAKGLLEVRSGSGMYVRDPAPELVSESINLYFRTRTQDQGHIYEVRRVLEVEIARLAAKRATPEDLARLEACVERIARPGISPRVFAQADVEFHAALARATQNELFQILLDSISDILTGVRLIGFALPETQKQAVHYHQLILERVKAGDEEGASQAMQEHLDESVETLRRAAESLSHKEAKSQ